MSLMLEKAPEGLTEEQEEAFWLTKALAPNPTREEALLLKIAPAGTPTDNMSAHYFAVDLPPLTKEQAEKVFAMHADIYLDYAFEVASGSFGGFGWARGWQHAEMRLYAMQEIIGHKRARTLFEEVKTQLGFGEETEAAFLRNTNGVRIPVEELGPMDELR